MRSMLAAVVLSGAGSDCDDDDYDCDDDDNNYNDDSDDGDGGYYIQDPRQCVRSDDDIINDDDIHVDERDDDDIDTKSVDIVQNLSSHGGCDPNETTNVCVYPRELAQSCSMRILELSMRCQARCHCVAVCSSSLAYTQQFAAR